MRSWDYGVYASGGLWPNLSPAAQNAHCGASNFTIRNGYLVQGGYGYLMYGMFAEFLNGGITVDNVSFTMQGMNATAVDAANARGNVTVTNSLIHSNMDAIDNRYLLYSFILMPGFDSGYSGNVDIDRNTLSGTGQVGISSKRCHRHGQNGHD